MTKARDAADKAPVAVTPTGTESLTNKTLIDPKLTLGGSEGAAGQALVSQGAGVSPVWATIGASLERVARTSNTQLVAADKTKLIDITSGTFTQTFAACADLGNGWYCYIRNSGTGDITLDPNGSETIDGLTSYVMYPGEVRLVQCDGTALRSVVLNAFYRTFTASGTFTKPPGYSSFSGLLWGGGGSGAAMRGNSNGDALYTTGGGGGACAQFNLPAAALGASLTVTIGSGGNARSSNTDGVGNAGLVGGTSQFGSVYAYGGGGGTFSASSGQAVYGGSGGGLTGAGITGTSASRNGGAGWSVANAGGNSGSLSDQGGAGGGNSVSVNAPNAGGNSYFGGGGGGAAMGPFSFFYGSSGGTSVFGGAGGAAGETAGISGTAPAGGGGAAKSSPGVTCTSGAGARGELRIWGII